MQAAQPDVLGDTGDRAERGAISMTRARWSSVALALAFSIVPRPAVSGAEACDPTSVALRWPVTGVEGKAWVINNYVDLDPSPGIRDYRGGAQAYDGHTGIDIDIPSFRQMDDDSAVVVAAAAGVVCRVEDGHFDRELKSRPTAKANGVFLEHPNGLRTTYLHLKSHAVKVRVGQHVEAGDPLGVVGSSGPSTQAHLHFEVRGCSGEVIDPFARGLWASPPSYDPPLRLMDVVLARGEWGSEEAGRRLKDPGLDVTEFRLADRLTVGLSMSGGRAGEAYRLRVVHSDGSIALDRTRTLDQPRRHTYWYWFATLDRVGRWTVSVETAAELQSFELAVRR
jgi:murein DD-endopeptidase MepM/ murein hydrolase activator NlpD